MLKSLKIALLVILSFLFQVTLFARLSILGSRFDPLLSLVIAIALLREIKHTELIGFVLGLSYDIFSGGPLGTYSLAMTIAGYVVRILRDRLYTNNPITQGFCGFTATIGVRFITSLYLALFINPRFFSISFFGLILVAIINSLFVIVFSWILRSLILIKISD
ncbi:rod shape-determining protein MreD [Candidatus Poribacteria bacterium]|nr:rod shape-determining protein MreD [Candidatus Poribacteria bacterium]